LVRPASRTPIQATFLAAARKAFHEYLFALFKKRDPLLIGLIRR